MLGGSRHISSFGVWGQKRGIALYIKSSFSLDSEHLYSTNPVQFWKRTPRMESAMGLTSLGTLNLLEERARHLLPGKSRPSSSPSPRANVQLINQGTIKPSGVVAKPKKSNHESQNRSIEKGLIASSSQTHPSIFRRRRIHSHFHP